MVYYWGMDQLNHDFTDRPPGYDALVQAIAYFDNSQANLAKALCMMGVKVSPMAISHWKERGVPLERCKYLEAVTQGTIPRERFRPDHFRDLTGDGGVS